MGLCEKNNKQLEGRVKQNTQVTIENRFLRGNGENKGRKNADLSRTRYVKALMLFKGNIKGRGGNCQEEIHLHQSPAPSKRQVLPT